MAGSAIRILRKKTGFLVLAVTAKHTLLIDPVIKPLAALARESTINNAKQLITFDQSKCEDKSTVASSDNSTDFKPSPKHNIYVAPH